MIIGSNTPSEVLRDALDRVDQFTHVVVIFGASKPGEESIRGSAGLTFSKMEMAALIELQRTFATMIWDQKVQLQKREVPSIAQVADPVTILSEAIQKTQDGDVEDVIVGLRLTNGAAGALWSAMPKEALAWLARGTMLAADAQVFGTASDG